MTARTHRETRRPPRPAAQRRSAGERARAIAPPSYGIDFLDRGGAVIQRDVGFEFETGWIVEKEQQKLSAITTAFGGAPVYKTLGRREVFFRDPAGNFDLMADDHSNIEFRTEPFAADTNNDIDNVLEPALQALEALALLLDAQNAGPFAWAAPLPMQGNGLLKNVRVSPAPAGAPMTASPQATVGVRQDQIHNLLDEISQGATQQTLMGVGNDYQVVHAAVGRANLAGNVNGNPPSLELKGLLGMLLSYIYRGGRPHQGAMAYAKLIAPVMARTDFAGMFNHLQPAEIAYFTGPNGPALFSQYVLNVAGVPGHLQLFRFGFGAGPTFLPALTRDTWLQGIAGGIDLLNRQHYPQVSDSLGDFGLNVDALNVRGVAEDGIILELRRMIDQPVAQWRPIGIRIARFVRALNRNTANPANPVAY
jgi:hypothetical protein